MKNTFVILGSILIGMSLMLSSCKKDEEATPDESNEPVVATETEKETETTTVTNYLLKGTWEPSNDSHTCDNKKDYYTFSSTKALLYGCDDGDPFEFKHSMSSDGKVFKLENLFTEVVETYTVTEFTETTMKANKGSVKFYLKKR